MKTLKYIATIAVILSFVGCTDDPIDSTWPELQVSNSYLNMDLSNEDGSAPTAQISLTAGADWTIDFYYPDSSDEDFEPWLSVSPASGNAGEYTITITAQPAPADRTAEMHIRVSDGDDNPNNDKIQYVHIEQKFISTEATLATCRDVIDGPDGSIYIVEGTVTSIANTEYGNWYLEDETGSIYIYGTLDANGGTKNFESLGIAVGDKVRVRGQKTTYGSTVELVDVTVLSIEKALIAVDPNEVELEKEAGEFTVDVTVNGDDFNTSIDADWLRFVGYSQADEKMTFAYDENTVPSPREATITLVSTQGEASSTVTISVVQLGPVPETTTISDAIDNLMGEYAAVEGTVAAICERGYVLVDGTSAILVYYGGGYDGEFAIGDKIKVVGEVGSYNNGPQFNGPDTVELVEKGDGSYDYPAPVALDGAAIDAIVAADGLVDITYFEATGVPGGSYHNIAVEGTDTALAFYYAPDDFNVGSYDGKTITVRGYYTSKQSGRINFIVTSIAE